MELKTLGWDDHFESQRLQYADEAWIPARVIRQDLNRYVLLTAKGEIIAILPGRFRNQALSKADLPTVGDWVMLNPDNDPAIIEEVLSRRSKFSRREAGETNDEQVVAANIDTVFVVTGLDNNFNANRIERYLLLCRNSGAEPVVVLNKADLCDNIQAKISELTMVVSDTPIHVLSALDAPTVEQLRGYVGPGKTGALLGSSGVGKSTIINALMGVDTQETGAVREGDSKGRHTTTHREMCLLPDGGLLIDTPGMREIQLWTDESSIDESFEDVAALALDCRFSDCQHESEPGCAVQAAIDAEELEASRLESYRKYHRELAHLDEKEDPSARAEKRRARRKFSKLIRNRPTKRD